MFASHYATDSWQDVMNSTNMYPSYQTDTSSFSSSPSSSFVCTPTLPQADQSDWEYALDQLKRQMYNTTSISVPSPILAMRQKRNDSEFVSFVNQLRKDPSFYFNSELSIADLSEYRRLRSENLTMRLLHCTNNNVDKSAVSRISKGIFLKSVTMRPTPTSPLGLSDASMTLDDAFTSNNIDFNDIIYQAFSPDFGQANTTDTFVPYSYTFGARFSDPIGHASDVLVRGRIPEWCQTLLLSLAVGQMPIHRGDTVAGLFPFAPEITVTFQSLADGSAKDAEPELTLCYERFALELSEPEMILLEDAVDGSGQSWEDRKKLVLEKMLFCDIPDDTAQVITTLATAWAYSQGYFL